MGYTRDAAVLDTISLTQKTRWCWVLWGRGLIKKSKELLSSASFYSNLLHEVSVSKRGPCQLLQIQCTNYWILICQIFISFRFSWPCQQIKKLKGKLLFRQTLIASFGPNFFLLHSIYYECRNCVLSKFCCMLSRHRYGSSQFCQNLIFGLIMYVYNLSYYLHISTVLLESIKLFAYLWTADESDPLPFWQSLPYQKPQGEWIRFFSHLPLAFLPCHSQPIFIDIFSKNQSVRHIIKNTLVEIRFGPAHLKNIKNR